jgi:hypothetical protein
MTYLPLPSSWAPVGNVTYKPWLNEQDAEEVCFASINLFAEDRFYPGSGRDTDSPPPPAPAQLPAPLPAPQPFAHSHGTRRNAQKGGPPSDSGDDGLRPKATPDAIEQSRFSGDATIMQSPPSTTLADVKEEAAGGGSGTQDEAFAAGRSSACHRNIINIAMTPLGPGPWDPAGRSKLSAKQRDALCKKASRELRYAHALPLSLLAFSPFGCDVLSCLVLCLQGKSEQIVIAQAS